MRNDLFQLHAELELSHWWFVGRRRILATLADVVLQAGDAARIVDIGCGTGANIAVIGRGRTGLGIDTSADAVDYARRRFPDVRFVHGYAPADIQEEAARADLFLLTDVLEHVPDDFALLSSLLAVAKPGAHVLLTVPAVPALWSEHDVSFGHYRRYTPERLRVVWGGLPVSERLFSYFNTNLYPVVRAVRTIGRLRGRSAGLAGTDLRQPPAPLNRLLTAVLGSEAARLRRRMFEPGAGVGAKGVSLIALLRREGGPIAVRQRPASVGPDAHEPRHET